MPRGDGTGPFGTGPGRSKPGSGKFSGQGLRLGPDCPRKESGKPTTSNFQTNTLLKIPALLVGIASIAAPAIVKIHDLLLERKAERQLNWEKETRPTITIEAETVESLTDEE